MKERKPILNWTEMMNRKTKEEFEQQQQKSYTYSDAYNTNIV